MQALRRQNVPARSRIDPPNVAEHLAFLPSRLRARNARRSVQTRARHALEPEQAQLEVFEFIEVYYNRQRRHSTLGYLSPSEFEEKSSSQPLQIELVA